MRLLCELPLSLGSPVASRKYIGAIRAYETRIRKDKVLDLDLGRACKDATFEHSVDI